MAEVPPTQAPPTKAAPTKVPPALVVLAAKLHASKAYDALSAVERAMDLLDYAGDACVDDVMECMAALSKPRDEEQLALQRAEMEMDRLVGAPAIAASTAVDNADDDDWAEPDPAMAADWQRILNVVDALESRLPTR